MKQKYNLEFKPGELYSYPDNELHFQVVSHIAQNIDGTLRPSPLPGFSLFDGQVFYKKKHNGI